MEKRDRKIKGRKKERMKDMEGTSEILLQLGIGPLSKFASIPSLTFVNFLATPARSDQVLSAVTR